MDVPVTRRQRFVKGEPRRFAKNPVETGFEDMTIGTVEQSSHTVSIYENLEGGSRRQ